MGVGTVLYLAQEYIRMDTTNESLVRPRESYPQKICEAICQIVIEIGSSLTLPVTYHMQLSNKFGNLFHVASS